jgi:hypothetical protein
MREASAGENPRAGKYRACWVVARFPKSGGTVKTTRRLQKGIESTVCPSDLWGAANVDDAGVET